MSLLSVPHTLWLLISLFVILVKTFDKRAWSENAWVEWCQVRCRQLALYSCRVVRDVQTQSAAGAALFLLRLRWLNVSHSWQPLPFEDLFRFCSPGALLVSSVRRTPENNIEIRRNMKEQLDRLQYIYSASTKVIYAVSTQLKSLYLLVIGNVSSLS